MLFPKGPTVNKSVENVFAVSFDEIVNVAKNTTFQQLARSNGNQKTGYVPHFVGVKLKGSTGIMEEEQKSRISFPFSFNDQLVYGQLGAVMKIAKTE